MKRSAFTLIELTISAALMALILVASYLCLSAALAGQKLIEPRAEVIQNARVAMAMISADLRSACPLSKESEFVGMHRDDIDADNLDFATHNYTPRHANEADYCSVSYFANEDGDSGNLNLYRRRNPMISDDPFSGGSIELIARGLRKLSFEYSDGWDTYDTWGDLNPRKQKEAKASELAPNLSGMPESVRIVLWFDPNPRVVPIRKNTPAPKTPEPPLMFETTVCLNLASASQSASSGAAVKAGQSADQQSPGNESQ